MFPSPEPTVSCIDDLDFFKDSENEFSAIVYNDALTSKLDFSTKPTLCPQHIDQFDLKDETSMSEYNEVEQNVLNFNDLFPFNIIYPYDLKSDKGNDDNEIDMIQSLGGNENTQGLNKLLEGSHDKITEAKTRFGREDEDGIHWGRWAGGICKSRLEEIVWDPSTFSSGQFFSTCKIKDEMGLDVAGLHTAKEMVEDGFRACWLGSERLILDKGYLSDYWIEISSDRDFLRGAPSYTYIRDPVRRLCHRLISYNIYGKGQTPEKYLFRHAKGRKSDARLSGGHFDGRLAHHFGLVSDDGLRGLTVVACELLLIDMGELIKLNICKEIGDDWDWVALRPERHSGELPTWVMMNPSSMFSGVESTCPTTAIDCFDELTRKIWRWVSQEEALGFMDDVRTRTLFILSSSKAVKIVGDTKSCMRTKYIKKVRQRHQNIVIKRTSLQKLGGRINED
ncbi:hypothetical protein Tco_1549195 [Tanacetum coccineum]